MKRNWVAKVVALSLCIPMIMGGNVLTVNADSGEKLKISFASTWDPAAGGSQEAQYNNWFLKVKEQYETKYPDREVEYSAYAWETIDAKLM